MNNGESRPAFGAREKSDDTILGCTESNRSGFTIHTFRKSD